MIKSFSKGTYAGPSTRERTVEGILLSESVYAKDTASDWHYHENPYFAFILDGGSKEIRKKGSLECLPGNIYFYNTQDIHRNKDYRQASRNFNVEFDNNWLSTLGIDISKTSGMHLIYNPDARLTLTRLFKECRIGDDATRLSVHTLSLQLLTNITQPDPTAKTPEWFDGILDLLNDRWTENIGLDEIAAAVNLHPVTIAKNFPKHLHCTMGEYLRKIRVERSLSLIRSTRMSLTEIAYQCGFADQSHFTRTFKRLTGFLPNDFRRA